MTAPHMTGRQIDVLRAAANGMTAKETAKALGIQPETVRQHRLDALKATGSRTITQAAVIAVRAGVL